VAVVDAARRPVAAALALCCAAAAVPAAAQPAATAACEGAVTGGGDPPARWAEVPEPGARDGRAFTETTRLAVADRYPVCAFPEPVARDLDVTLRFKPVAGRLDRAGGVAVRVQDPDTYYVARANAAESNVRLYHVTGGRRVQFAGRERQRIAVGAWHTLRLRLEGDRFAVWFDGAPMFEARDARVAGTGRIALWSIADSHTLYERPSVEVLR